MRQGAIYNNPFAVVVFCKRKNTDFELERMMDDDFCTVQNAPGGWVPFFKRNGHSFLNQVLALPDGNGSQFKVQVNPRKEYS